MSYFCCLTSYLALHCLGDSSTIIKIAKSVACSSWNVLHGVAHVRSSLIANQPGLLHNRMPGGTVPIVLNMWYPQKHSFNTKVNE